MKRPFIKILGLLVVVIAIALVFTSYQSKTKYRFDKTSEALHKDLITTAYKISPKEAMEFIENDAESYQFIDVRNPREYDNFHITGSINVPLQRVLDDEFIPYLKSDKKKVLYSNQSIKADQVRVLLTQYGYENLFVLQGGVDYWKENMINRDIFKSETVYDDETLKFDIKKISSSNQDQ